jgi:hypothetical protein
LDKVLRGHEHVIESVSFGKRPAAAGAGVTTAVSTGTTIMTSAAISAAASSENGAAAALKKAAGAGAGVTADGSGYIVLAAGASSGVSEIVLTYTTIECCGCCFLRHMLC